MPMGWDELAIVIVLAVIILGPSRLPEYAAKLARGIRQLRVMADGARTSLKEQMGPEFEDIDWRQYDPRQYDPRRIVRDALREPLEEAWNPVRDEVASVRRSAGEIGRGTAGSTAVSAAEADAFAEGANRTHDDGQFAAAGTTPYDADAT